MLFFLLDIVLFLGGFNDCVFGFKWVIENGVDFGIDMNYVIVVGESGGGNLIFVIGLKFK